LDAAERGLGIVLGRSPLIEDEIASGRLIPLAAQAVPSGGGYWLVTSQSEFQKPEVKTFKQWLLSELGAGNEERKPVRHGARLAPKPAAIASGLSDRTSSGRGR
jgi:LysR family glycine cleavage system transcriptional activator